VRFAPSPTGRTHLGSGRTALYDYLLAHQTGGQFILRIEDTDQKRYVPGAEEELIKSLRWLGLEWDEGPDVGGPYKPYHQSERREIYQHYAQKLVDSGHAYPCFCPPERLERIRKQQQEDKRNPRYDGKCRQIDPDEAAKRVTQGENHVIRFKTPLEGSTSVKDRLRGEISVENNSLDDYILIKSDGLAVYHLAAMVDDHLMDITHVIRGSEWLPTFPLHGLIYRAFGWEEPEWVHLSIFLKPSGKGKMSKRESAQLMKGGKSIFIEDLKKLGYLPEAVVNWVALMGWSYDDRTEFFTMQDLIDKFSLDRLNPSPAAINFSKLDHFNGLHIRNLSVAELATRIKPFLQKAGYEVKEEKLEDIASSLQVRLHTLEEAPEKAGFFFEEQVEPKAGELIGKKMSAAQSAQAAQQVYRILESLEEISPETAEQPLRNLADQLDLKAGQLFGILRVAITGQKVSPPLFESMAIIGKKKVLERINNAVIMLRNLATKE
jgi:glutamyl-tRNA synthetase